MQGIEDLFHREGKANVLRLVPKDFEMQEMPDKNFNPTDAENLDQEQLHPKIFETFSWQAGTATLAA